MTRKRNAKGQFVSDAQKAVRDSLTSFTKAAQFSMSTCGYRDGPFSGYAKDAQVRDSHYNQSWIARAAVEMIPEDCFKRGYQWVADSAQIALLEAEERRLRIRKKKRQALTWSRKDGEAYLYFDTGQDASQELRLDSVGRGGLRFVNALRMVDVQKGNTVTDPMSQYHGQPEYYTIGTVRIHPSRMCRFVNGEDPNTNQGVSVLAYMLAPIVAAEVARDNTVALTTEALINVLSVDGLMDAVQDPETERQIVARYSLMSNLKATNKTIVIDKERETFDRKPSQFATLPDVIETMRREVAAAIGVPYSLLFGRPQGLGTNGDVELKNYYDNIATMQRNDIQPVCEALDECIIRSALGSRPEEIYIDWLSLYEMSDQEKATVAKTMADAAQVAINAGAVPASLMTGPLVNSWVEIGAFQGIDQEYQEWIDAGGWEAEDVQEEGDVLRGGEEDDTVAA